MAEVNVPKCPRCGGNLSRVWETKNIFKCEGGCLLKLAFITELRKNEKEEVIWVDQEGKEYPAEIIGD